MGHEFTGEVVEAGQGVKFFNKGDQVVSAFTTSWYDWTQVAVIENLSNGIAVEDAFTVSRDSLPVARSRLSLDVITWMEAKHNM